MADKEEPKIQIGQGYTPAEVKEMIQKRVGQVEGLTDEEKEMQVKALTEVFIEGKNPSEAMKFPEGFSKVLYRQGYDLYNLGLYDEANAVFRLLCTLEPDAPRYHLALAASNHQLGKYEIASSMYMIAYFLDPSSPIPLYYISDCFLKMNEPDASYFMLQMTAEACGTSPPLEKLKTRCYMMMSQMRDEFGIGKEHEAVEGVPEGKKDIFSQLQKEAEKGKSKGAE